MVKTWRFSGTETIIEGTVDFISGSEEIKQKGTDVLAPIKI